MRDLVSSCVYTVLRALNSELDIWRCLRAVDVMEEVMSEDEEKPDKKGKGKQRKDQGDKRKR